MSDEPFGDVPLFREIQKLLSAGHGPVNLEIARQVGTAVAGGGSPSTRTDPTRAAALGAAVRAAEPVIAGYTRIPLTEPARVALVTRPEWVQTSLAGWRWLLDALATHLANQLQRSVQHEADEAAGGMGAILGQVTPLLLGMQAGTLLGHLARESLGRYDPWLPRADDLRLFFVPHNIDEVLDEYSIDAAIFTSWLAGRDTARHHLATNVGWIDRYFRGLLEAVIDALEIDPGDLERKLMELQSEGMGDLQRGIAPHDLLPLVPTDRHRTASARLTAFVALLEGYAAHSWHAVSDQMLGATAMVDEAMARRDLAPHEGEAILFGLLGISPEPGLDSAATTFCKALVELHGMSALNRVWEAPDNLPSIAELRDPFQWIERVLAA
ncbi:MAG: zinc-dependent metalloprotease [Actinomycetota bacterium]